MGQASLMNDLMQQRDVTHLIFSGAYDPHFKSRRDGML
jgi:hypothetical protein